FGVYGGGYTLSLSRSFPIDAAALARPDLRPRPVRSINMSQLGRVLCEPLDPPVAALFVYNANPVAMAPDQNRVLRGLQRDDLFTVVHEQVMTDTARFADVLLPATTVFEQSELHKSYGHYFLQYSDAVIPPVGESRSNAEMFGALAARLGVGEPSLFEPERLLDVALLPGRVEGVGSEQLRQRRAVAVRGGGQRAVIQMVTDLPLTPSGKIELDAAGFGPIEYRSLPPSGYPLALLSPASARLINSTFGEFNLPEPRLEMHPGDAEARGLRQGEVVRVYNDLGCVEVVLRLSSDIRPGCCSLPKGLWRHTTRNGSTATALAPDHLSDYGEGACFNDARVEVESARPSRPTTV
ncbi:MAG TPA: molybdopterin-dependent oxidoreductase, partial [Terriglobales bacterium]|nr:molybdopterin-dependent oxidoreductase [Terriglobales bacterium]